MIIRNKISKTAVEIKCSTTVLCYPIKFSRQKVLGKYIVDFYSAEAKLIIELDGSQHYEEKGIKKDFERTAYLEQYGLKILRIPNNQVNQNFRGVCEYIDNEVKQSLHR